MTNAVHLLQRRRTAAVELILAFALCTAMLAYTASSASAVSNWYCYGTYVYPGQHCDAPDRHSLDENDAYNYDGFNYRVCAGATLNGSFYGSYACNGYHAIQCYSGANLLVGRIHNGEGTAVQRMAGLYYYSGSPNCI
jgi:hypothetical protein